MWSCPSCGRSFRNTNQDHSCLIIDLELHFVNKHQNVIDTYKMLQDEVTKFEGIRITPVKNAILFTAKSHFLAVKPKKTWLDIEFVLNKKIEGFPIHKSAQATKTKWAHFMRLESPEEVDEQLLSWIRKAYDVCK